MARVTQRSSASNAQRAPQSYVAVLQEVRQSGLTVPVLAKAVGASPRTVQTWAAGSSRPSGVRASRLLDVQLTLSKLGELYTPEGINIWLNSRNSAFEMRRPMELLQEGEIDRVREEVESLVGGW
ncbi:antitoxin Xre/MbcA/ParS toxin-binding domain-containing protein [Janibacter hoylei]|uniref:antitoxin Xre/MbcA/ParS toxin-binding domain-containing protein n=1 Tax=Janibacter hoylei TaxID=364298 RepID=UPI003899A016